MNPNVKNRLIKKYATLGILLLTIALPITLYQVRQNQDNRSSAAAADKLEAEGGLLSGNATKQTDTLASGGSYVKLQISNATPTPDPSKPIVGVIRWDAWTPNLHPTTTTQNKWITADLGKWGYRLPFFAKNLPNNTKDSEVINEDSQEIIDKEILYTSQAGINYWTFFWFNFWWQDSNTTWRYNYGLNNYLNSPYKNKMNFALMLGCCGLLDHYPTDWEPKVVPKIVNLVKQPTYQKVLNGRPIIYVFGASQLSGWFNCGYYDYRYGTCADKSYTKSKVALDYLRAEIQKAGLPNPYLVAMVWDPGNKNYTSSTGYGFDAITSYSGHDASVNTLTQKSYTTLSADNLAYREKAKASGNKIIPPVNTGWDRRPDPGYNGVWYEAGTPIQVGANLKAAIDWNKANPTLTETNNVLIYAWNEFVEGGWLGPTLEDKGARLNAISNILGGTQIKP